MTAEDLIKNNSLTDIEVTGNQTIVFSEIALTAVNMAREEVKCKWKKLRRHLSKMLKTT